MRALVDNKKQPQHQNRWGRENQPLHSRAAVLPKPTLTESIRL